MWICKECGSDIMLIEITTTIGKYQLKKNKTKGKLYNKVEDSSYIGYVCSDIDCENNREYTENLTDIAEWVEE